MQVLMMLVGGLVLAFLVVYGAYSFYRDVIKRKEQ